MSFDTEPVIPSLKNNVLSKCDPAVPYPPSFSIGTTDHDGQL